MASRNCLIEVNRTVRAAGLAEKGVDAAVVSFARDLARRMDEVGPAKAPLNLLRLYQSAIKDLQRAVDRVAASNRPRNRGEDGSDEGSARVASPPTLTLVKESALDKVRKNKQRAAG